MDAPAYKKPLPRIDPVSRPFWENARQKKLSIQVCDACHDKHFPGSPVCPACLSSKQHWEVVSGRGELMSWVEFHQVYWESFRPEIPYRVCLVKLDEGPMLMSNIVGTAGKDVPVGARLKVVFEPVTDAVTLPKFELA